MWNSLLSHHTWNASRALKTATSACQHLAAAFPHLCTPYQPPLWRDTTRTMASPGISPCTASPKSRQERLTVQRKAGWRASRKNGFYGWPTTVSSMSWPHTRAKLLRLTSVLKVSGWCQHSTGKVHAGKPLHKAFWLYQLQKCVQPLILVTGNQHTCQGAMGYSQGCT